MKPVVQRSERDLLIDRVLAKSRGIYGCEVCQLCGRLGGYSSYFGAFTSHFAGCEFVASGHRHPKDFGRRGELLAKRDSRYCEVCQTKVSRSSAHPVGNHWLCDTCVADPTRWDPDATYPFVRLFGRRYVEGLSDDELRARA